MVNTMSVADYMLDRRKTIDRYVEGEHKWFGCTETSTLVESLSMYPSPKPWYLSEQVGTLEIDRCSS